MILVGLTGGIGAGKSAVSALLAERGATIVDADELARLVVAPGEPGHEAVVARFGEELVDEQGMLDRAGLAALVFSDEGARRDLEAIVHPAVQQLMAARVEVHAGTDDVVVLAIPLLVRADGSLVWQVDGVLLVDAPEDLAIERLVEHRQMDEAHARARVAAQVSRTTRLQAADFVILNVGTLPELSLMVERAWHWIGTLSPGEKTPS